MRRTIPRWIHLAVLVLTVLALIPPVLIARARVTKSPQPRIHPIPDMDNQKKYRAQAYHSRYEDKRAMRPPVPGTVARGELKLDDHFFRGYTGPKTEPSFFDKFPDQVDVTMDFIGRGRSRFEIFCVPCHGYAASGDGMVANRASVVSEATWNFDLDLHTEERRGRAVGHLFNTITNGNQNMPAYGDKLSERDRWAVVSYLRSLQASETLSLADVSATARVGSAAWPDYTPAPEPPATTAGSGGDGDKPGDDKPDNDKPGETPKPGDG